jgi:transmembrane sensor
LNAAPVFTVNDARLNELRAEQIAQEAAAWVLRSDRGLTAAEQDEFSSWLASDPRHGEQLARHRRHWNRLDRLAQWRPEHGDLPNPDLLAPPPNHSRRVWQLVVLPLAAAIALVFWLGQPARNGTGGARPTAAATPTPADPSASRVLEDGTMVDLNRGAILTTRYSPGERRVILEHGEAHFAVTKDPGRPFIVQAGGVDVRAVGTAFNVRIGVAAVEVLVTEGRVQLGGIKGSPGAGAGPMSAPPPPVLEARQRAVVSRGATPPAPRIDTLTRGEIERVLAWQQRLLDFNATPLREIVAEFNRRNVVQLVVSDAELASVRISAAFRSDNIEGFVSLLEAGFGARAERRSDTEIVLRRVTAEPKPD